MVHENERNFICHTEDVHMHVLVARKILSRDFVKEKKKSK